MGAIKTLFKKKKSVGFWAGDANNFQFVQELIDELAKSYVVKKFTYDNDNDALMHQLRTVDIAWFEWGNGPLIEASKFEKSTPLVARIHRYELYSESPKLINWKNVDKLIFSSPSMISRFESKFPEQDKQVNKELIPIGVDLSRFSFTDKPITKELLYVGRIHPHKNPSILLQIMAKLITIDPEYKLRVVGGFSDELYEEYFYDQIEKLGLKNNVEYCGVVPHQVVHTYMESADYILITSIIEGLSQATLEAMACGVRPLISNYYGSDAAYPKGSIYNTIDEAVDMILNPILSREECRYYIESKFNLDDSIVRVKDILKGFHG